MTYNPNIPLGTDNISVDRASMQVNFDQANTLFDNDHYAFDDATSANRGYHRQIFFPAALGADPSLGGFLGVLYPKVDTNDTSNRMQIYFKNATGVQQVTSRFQTASASGYIQLPGTQGLFMMWFQDSVTLTGGNTQQFFTKNYPITISNYNYAGPGFPTGTLQIFFTIVSDSTSKNLLIQQSSGTPPTLSTYTVNARSSTANDTITYNVFAMGY